jgi:hypothetical protein
MMLAVWGTAPALGGSEAARPDAGPAATRVLHFPKDQCVGWLCAEAGPGPHYTCVENRFDPSLPWGLEPVLLDLRTLWDMMAKAQGDVIIPADRPIQLGVLLRPRYPPAPTDTFWRDRCPTDPVDLSGLADLGPDDLYKLDANCTPGGAADADERVLKPLARLTGLQMLHLSWTGTTDKGMEHLRNLRRLRSLELSEPRVGNSGLAVLKDLTALEYLDLETGAGDAGLKHVGQLPNLRWTRIRMGGIRGPGLAELARLPRLERLCLWGETGITDQHVRYLEGLTHLKSLTLWGTSYPLTDATLASIGKLTGLEELYFVRIATDFTDEGMAYLKGLKNLRKVEFTSPVGELGLRHLATLPRLESIKPLELTGENIKQLAGLRACKSVRVDAPGRAANSGRLPDLSSLGGLPSLEELEFFDNDWVTDRDLACLPSLARLKSLFVSSENVTDASLTVVAKLTQLEHLNFMQLKGAKRGLNQLNALTNLQTLDMVTARDMPQTIDEIPLNLSALVNLRTLRLRQFCLSDNDLACLAGLHHLEVLDLDGAFTETALSYLKDLPEVRIMHISRVTCTDGQGLVALGSMPNLADLTLYGRITDAALQRLSGFPSLWSLTVYTDEPIRPETVAYLKQALPALQHLHFYRWSLSPGQATVPTYPRQGRRGINPPRINRPAPQNPRRLR